VPAELAAREHVASCSRSRAASCPVASSQAGALMYARGARIDPADTFIGLPRPQADVRAGEPERGRNRRPRHARQHAGDTPDRHLELLRWRAGFVYREGFRAATSALRRSPAAHPGLARFGFRSAIVWLLVLAILGRGHTSQNDRAIHLRRRSRSCRARAAARARDPPTRARRRR